MGLVRIKEDQPSHAVCCMTALIFPVIFPSSSLLARLYGPQPSFPPHDNNGFTLSFIRARAIPLSLNDKLVPYLKASR